MTTDQHNFITFDAIMEWLEAQFKHYSPPQRNTVRVLLNDKKVSKQRCGNTVFYRRGEAEGVLRRRWARWW